MKPIPNPIAKFGIILIQLIKLYQLTLSPYAGRGCRFFPSCSQYMIESLQVLGVPIGFLGGLRRLLRCHPFSTGGWDPVKR